MLLIFGTRVSAVLIVLVMMVCPHCHVEAQQRVVKHVNKFTLFFIPLFPVSTRYFVECSNCGAATALTKEEADNSVAWVAGRGGHVAQ